MSLWICTTCGGVKEVRGASDSTAPMVEAMQVKNWCTCKPSADWWPYTFEPPQIVTERDAEIVRLRSELAGAEAKLNEARERSAWLWRCLREMRKVRNFYLDHVAKTTKYFRRKGHLMLGFCESVDEILFHEHYSRYDQRQDEFEAGG